MIMAMATRGKNAVEAEEWVGAAATICYMFNAGPEAAAIMGQTSMVELFENMPEEIRNKGNEFMEQMGFGSNLIP